jgi:hypothetical protein
MLIRFYTTQLPIGKVQQGSPIDRAVVMLPFPEPDADLLFRLQEAIGFLHGAMGLSGPRRVGPQVAQRFGA